MITIRTHGDLVHALVCDPENVRLVPTDPRYNPVYCGYEQVFLIEVKAPAVLEIAAPESPFDSLRRHPDDLLYSDRICRSSLFDAMVAQAQEWYEIAVDR